MKEEVVEGGGGGGGGKMGDWISKQESYSHCALVEGGGGGEVEEDHTCHHARQ